MSALPMVLEFGMGVDVHGLDCTKPLPVPCPTQSGTPACLFSARSASAEVP